MRTSGSRARFLGELVISSAIRTIQCTFGFFSSAKLESAAHVGERRLSRFCDWTRTLDDSIRTALLALFDLPTKRPLFGRIR